MHTEVSAITEQNSHNNVHDKLNSQSLRIKNSPNVIFQLHRVSHFSPLSIG